MKVDLRNSPHWKKAKRRDRVKIKWYDVYDLNHTLAQVIWPALKLFREQSIKTHGAGSQFFYDLADGSYIPFPDSPVIAILDELRDLNYHGVTQSQQNLINDEWVRALDAMIWSFQESAEFETRKPKRPYEATWKDTEYPERGITKMEFEVDATPEQEEKYHLERKKYYERVRYGLKLFGQFYECLWH